MPKNAIRSLAIALSIAITIVSSITCLKAQTQSAESKTPENQKQETQELSFDESFDLWPTDLKIGGTIIASGGGKISEAALEYLQSESEKRRASTLVVRFSDHTEWDEDKASQLFEDATKLAQLEIAADATELDKQDLDLIRESNIVVVAIDDVPEPSQLPVLKSLLFAARTSVAEGGTLFLKGPCIEYLGEYRLSKDSDDATPEAAFHLFPSAIIRSGYQDKTNRTELVKALDSTNRTVGIGIEENTSVILRGRKIRVLGEGRSTFLLAANEDKPVRVQHVRQATSRRASPYSTTVDLTAWRRDAIERTVATFPGAEPVTPIVDNGTLIIVGGGGTPAGLMRKMVNLAGGRKAKMVYIPCSEADEISGPQRTVEQWKRMGVESATFIHTKDRNKANSDEEFLEPLREATCIWFGGGRQWNLADSYYGTEAHRLMKDVLARGGVVGGSSAGASIQAEYMCRANPVANFDIMAPGYERGLGFIGGIAIDQHFSQRRRQKDMTQLVDRYPQLLGIGIDESTAIIVQKSTAEVVGKGKVFFYNRNEPVVSGKDDFLALGSGSSYDLANRILIEEDEEEADSKAESQ